MTLRRRSLWCLAWASVAMPAWAGCASAHDAKRAAERELAELRGSASPKAATTLRRAVATSVAPAGPPCPAPAPRSPVAPPWELRHRFDLCVRGPEGRWSVEPDTTDRDGYRHHLRFDGANGASWALVVTVPTGLARRLDGSLVVLDLKSGVTLVSPEGAVVWRSTYPSCGSVAALAAGFDDEITVACGYSVIRLDARGALRWQVWPFRDGYIRNVWVDTDHVAYVSGNGRVAALGADGRTLWTTSTGFNRAIGTLVWNTAGNLVFDTSMDARHSDPSESGGYSFYYDEEPNELFEVDRRGAIVRRMTYESAPPAGGWPAVLPVDEDGGHRAP